jgi:hypothetical protein
MQLIPAERKSQELTERMVDGFLQYDYTETWIVNATGIAASLLDPLLPVIGQPYLILGVESPVFCYQRTPRRRSDTQAKMFFDVVCTFTNAISKYDRTYEGWPANQPESIVPRVDIAFEEYSEPSPRAQFVGIFDQDTAPAFFAPQFSYQIPPYLSAPQFGIDRAIVNSANDPQQNINKRSHTKRVTYWTWHRDWNSSWDDYIDSVNSNTTTITQSDLEGQRLQYSFEPYSLLINDIIKEDHWRDGKLYFRRGVVFSHNPATWFLQVTDQGYNEMLFVGQNKEGGGTVTENDMDDLFGADRADYESLAITYPVPIAGLTAYAPTETRVAPAEPQLLNGHGRQIKIEPPDSTSFLPKKMVYMPYTVKDFSALGIS